MVVIEKGPSSFGAYVPDLPGCIAAAETKEEVLEVNQEAINFHLEGIKAERAPGLSHIHTGNLLKHLPNCVKPT